MTVMALVLPCVHALMTSRVQCWADGCNLPPAVCFWVTVAWWRSPGVTSGSVQISEDFGGLVAAGLAGRADQLLLANNTSLITPKPIHSTPCRSQNVSA